MNLFDQLKGMFTGGAKEAEGTAGDVSVIEGLTKQAGGLGGLLEKFKLAGMADHVKSWVGMGPNKDVSGEQVEAAVGSNKIAELAHSLGLDKNALLSKITSFLPKIVDKLTPTGEVPHDGLVGQALDALKKHLPGGGK